MNRSSPGWTLALTSIAFVMVTLDALVVVTALPAIHREFGADLAQLEWTINAFTLAFAAGIITAAALGDRFGRRRVFVTGLAVFTAASAACALAPNAGLLVAARSIQGLGAAMVMPLSLTILVAAFPPERRGDAEPRSEEHTSELQSLAYLVCRLLLEKKKKTAESSL